MAKCPKCGEEVQKPYREWDYGVKKNPNWHRPVPCKNIHYKYYRCSQGHGFTLWVLEEETKK
jgi:hypothetical protein